MLSLSRGRVAFLAHSGELLTGGHRGELASLLIVDGEQVTAFMPDRYR